MYISLFGRKEQDTKLYFIQTDKVVIGSHSIIECAFQVGNFYNLLQKSTSEGNINAYKHNLLLELNRLQSFENGDVYLFTELLEYVHIKDYKKNINKILRIVSKTLSKILYK